MLIIDFRLLKASTAQLGIVLLAAGTIELVIGDAPGIDVLILAGVGLGLLFTAIARTKK